MTRNEYKVYISQVTSMEQEMDLDVAMYLQTQDKEHLLHAWHINAELTQLRVDHNI